MKLRDYMNLVDEGAEITCWDKDIDSEFYFYNNPNGAPDPDFPNDFALTERLIDLLDVVKIRDGGIEVNLYELLENPRIVQFAKDNLYEDYQYADDSDLVMLLFDDNVKNISQGFEGFSEDMIKCLDFAYGDIEGLKGIPVADVNKLIASAKTKAEATESEKTGNEYFKFSDGMFSYYVNKSTGEKKLKLDEGDVEVAANLDDFMRE